MDLDDFRVILGSTGVDVWTFINTAIAVASADYGDELKDHRDRIVERLYASAVLRCRNCDGGGGHANAASSAVKEGTHHHQNGKRPSPPSPQSLDEEGVVVEEEERDHLGHQSPIDDEQTRILGIKEHLEDPHQTEDAMVELLQTLADMDITFKALKETDIGRHVNRLRKNPSSEVRSLVKQLVRKWKDLVDDWVRFNNASGDHVAAPSIMDGDSPQQKLSQNGHHQVPDFAYSPNLQNGSSGSERNNRDPEPKSKPLSRREAPPARPQQATPPSAHASSYNKQREQREEIDMERLASARKRLQQNYQSAENAKKQRTIQVMDIHEIPKPKNGFIAKNKGPSSGGGGLHHGRHW